jgi:hypothetical protein
MFHDGGPASNNRVSKGKSLLHRNDIERSTPTKKRRQAPPPDFDRPRSG